jgi:hypothetical protein
MPYKNCVFVAPANTIIPPPSLVQAFLAQCAHFQEER